jgi:capsular polysaccharide biosynthesis protein
MIVVIAAVACALLAWILSAMQPARYRASAIAAVAPVSDSLSAGDVLRGVEVLERRTVVATVAALAETPAAGEAPDGFDISASVLPNTNLFRVNVEGPDAAQVAQLANNVVPRLSAQTRSMFRYYAVTPVSPATAPTSAFFPRTGRAVASGLLAGLLIGAAIAWLLDRRQTMRTV